MRIVFCGSGDFGVPTLRELAAGGDEIVRVFTQPPRPAGRRGKIMPTPVAAVAEELSLPTVTAEDINSDEHAVEIEALAPDVLLVIDFGQKIGPRVRAAAGLEAINLHGSLLPELRGAAPVNWAIIRGCEKTGVTVIALSDHIDAGAIFRQRSTDIRPDETAEELRRRLADLGVEAVADTLAMLSDGECDGVEQDESQATTARRLRKSDGLIDWSADAVVVRNLIHGVWPWPGGQTQYVVADGKRTDVVIARAVALEADGQQGRPGEIGGELTVFCGGGRLGILQLKPAGRRIMEWRDFVNGYRVSAGARFETAF
ncbi:MAG: methionyl-tRNA formyltransferase [Planctomycetota bacterium]|nr:methionyl-tRNA formyltransferase [Planctomycetota bacterium]